jgi:hypothetical protein
MAMRQLRVYTEPDLTWLGDFADDEITISSDLHDVLQAYRHFRRPGA